MDGGTASSANIDEVNLLDYCRVVWKRRGLITALCIGSILISAAYTFWVPKVYRAMATILSPVEIGLGSLMSLSTEGAGGRERGANLLGSLVSGGILSVKPQTPTRDTYIAILRSRTIREEVIEYFKKSWGSSVDSLIQETEVTSSKGEMISVTVVAQDPKLSAEVANYYFESLSSLLARRAKATAMVQKGYYDRQFDRTRQELKKAQDSLIKFQEKNRYIVLDSATKNAIAIGAIQAGSVMALEMERNLMRRYLTDQHPQMIALNQRIYESKKLVSHRLYGEPQVLPPETPGAPPRKEFFVASTKMTPLQFKLMKVYRDLQFRQSIENSIHQNIESLKQTIENPPAVFIDWLDRAIPPGGPFKPDIRYNVAAAGIGSLIFGIFLALFLEYIERIRTLEQRRQ